MVKEIKSIHPEFIALIKLGGFYKVYGKDAYIISKNFKYKIKEEAEIISCGFPTKTINKVRSKLENKKINYLIIESKNNYEVNEKEDFKNLNNYEKELEKSKIYVKNQLRIEKIYNFLSENAQKEKTKNIIKEIEEIIYAKGKI